MADKEEESFEDSLYTDEKKQSEEQKSKHEELLESINSVMSTRQGRRVIWNILSTANLYDHQFIGETNSLYFREGRRSVSGELLVLIDKKCPDMYLKMVIEARPTEEENDGSSSSDS